MKASTLKPCTNYLQTRSCISYMDAVKYTFIYVEIRFSKTKELIFQIRYKHALHIKTGQLLGAIHI